MTNNPIDSIAPLIGIGVMAYAAKGVIDVLKDEKQKTSTKKKITTTKKTFSVNNSLQKMLR